MGRTVGAIGIAFLRHSDMKRKCAERAMCGGRFHHEDEAYTMRAELSIGFVERCFFDFRIVLGYHADIRKSDYGI